MESKSRGKYLLGLIVRMEFPQREITEVPRDLSRSGRTFCRQRHSDRSERDIELERALLPKEFASRCGPELAMPLEIYPRNG